MTEKSVRLITRSPEETKDVAARLAGLLRPNDVVALRGVLGAGKTCFVKGLARGLGVKDERAVSSASFVLMKQHRGRLALYHFDAYRLSGGEDMEAIGCAEIFASGGVSVIEWADHVAECLPEEYIAIDIVVRARDSRELAIRLSGPDSGERLEGFAAMLSVRRT